VDADALHAGVDLQVHLGAATEAAGTVLDGLELAFAGNPGAVGLHLGLRDVECRHSVRRVALRGRSATVWGGFSTKWYVSLFHNQGLMDATWVTARVGVISATVATVLGTLAALTLTRYTRFRGRVLFSGMVFAPLVMPEVITGLSLLLLFVAVGLDRGFLTVTLAHITLTMCFVAVVVQSRLVSFDRSLEEAAMDLGATPVKTFFQITLPVIMPAIVSGWMLAFTLSLDDLVIASFTSGPGATTLPMKIYSQVRLGVTPEINAACTILIAVVAVGVIIASVANKRREVQRQLDEQAAQRG